MNKWENNWLLSAHEGTVEWSQNDLFTLIPSLNNQAGVRDGCSRMIQTDASDRGSRWMLEMNDPCDCFRRCLDGYSRRMLKREPQTPDLIYTLVYTKIYITVCCHHSQFISWWWLLRTTADFATTTMMEITAKSPRDHRVTAHSSSSPR